MKLSREKRLCKCYKVLETQWGEAFLGSCRFTTSMVTKLIMISYSFDTCVN
jgi:hypothetical protein